MTTTRSNPKYLDRSHPIRTLLEQAARGSVPTKAELDRALNRSDLPDGHDLGRFRKIVVDACNDLASYTTSGGHQHGKARSLADGYVGRIAPGLTDAEAAVSGIAEAASPHPDDMSISDLGAQMFKR